MSLRVEKIRSEDADEDIDVSSYKILSYPADYTLEGLFLKWEKGDIVIPPFQRRYVWTISQASRLVESFLLGLPVPGIFLYKDAQSEKLLVIDGQQRLKSVVSFIKGRFGDTQRVFSLQRVREPWAGKAFEELNDAEKGQIKNSVLRATVIQQLDPNDDTSVFHIFERLNTGGTTLTPQEVRNCIYAGKLNELLATLNADPVWRKVIGKKEVDPRMRDTELILRVFAVARDIKNYSKPMKDFLSAFMKRHRNPSAVVLAQMKADFERSAKTVAEKLGPKPFHIRLGVNVPTCEAVFAVVMNTPNTPQDLKERYKALLKDEEFQSYTSDATTDNEIVKKRYLRAAKILTK